MVASAAAPLPKLRWPVGWAGIDDDIAVMFFKFLDELGELVVTHQSMWTGCGFPLVANAMHQ